MERRERPILFSGPMVRAIIEGRKTQTRRIVKFPYWFDSDAIPRQYDGYCDVEPTTKEDIIAHIKCPYGIPGDRLWVRETWNKLHMMDENDLFMYDENGDPVEQVFYAATDDGVGDRYYDGEKDEYTHMKWKPSIFMPRWASRITLVITGIRVERLQDITDEDVLREGFRMDNTAIFSLGYQGAFKLLWDSINGKKHPWESNPWVWVVEFRRAKD